MACEHEWQPVECAYSSRYRCSSCGAVGYVRNDNMFSKARRRKVLPYKCSTKGCVGLATRTFLVGRHGNRLAWFCTEHTPPQEK